MGMMIQPARFPAPASADPVIAGTQRHVENSNWFGNTVNSDSPAEGDLIILYLAHGTNLNTGLPITWPAGFTEGGRLVRTSAASGAWAWKVAGASEPSTYSLTWGGTGTRSVLTLVRFSVHGGIAGYSMGFVDSNTNTMIAPAFSSTQASSMRLSFFSFGWGGGTMTATPAVMTPPVSLLLSPLMTTAGDYSWCCGSMLLTRLEPADSYPSFNTAISWTSGINGLAHAAFTIAVRPKP